MVFARCWKCLEELAPPTAREDLMDGWFCSKGHRQQRRFTTEEWVCLMYDNIVDLYERTGDDR